MDAVTFYLSLLTNYNGSWWEFVCVLWHVFLKFRFIALILKATN